MDNTRFLVTGYVENSKDKLNSIVDYIYKYSKSPDNKINPSEFIIAILKKEGFYIKKDTHSIKNSFIAHYKDKSPKVLYICQFDEIQTGRGSNIGSAINIGAAIGLRRILDDIGGSVFLFGCPISNKKCSVLELQKLGTFDKMDAVICAQAFDRTCQSGSSLDSSFLPLKTHPELSKVLSHNLKESGIINVNGPIDTLKPQGLGNISHKIPTVSPYIGICPEGVLYGTREFDECTIEEFSKEIMIKAACALALTGLDIIQMPSILKVPF